MNRYCAIFAVLLATVLTGCGVRKTDHQRALKQLVQTRRQLQAAAAEAEDLRTGVVVRLKLDLKRANDRIVELNAEVERLKKLDVYMFTEAGRLLDTGNLTAALRAYQAFVRDFPSSPQIAAAREQIQLIEQRIETQRREEAVRAERAKEEQAQKEIVTRAREGLTVAEYWELLRGQTAGRVRELLGTPGHTSDDDSRWTYYSRAVMPSSGKKETLRVYFRNGTVSATQGESPGTLFSD